MNIKLKKITRKQWIKIAVSACAILVTIAMSICQETFAKQIIWGIISGLVLWLFLFILWYPEQRKRWASRSYKKRQKEKMAKKVPSKFLNKVLIKDNWMDNVYNEICLNYLSKKHKDHSVEMMEKVLFLMHEKSLSNLDRPFIRRSIYLDDKRVRIAGLSDRLRVKELEPVKLSGTYFLSQVHPPDYWEYMKIYEIMLQDFMEKSEMELDEMIVDKRSRKLPKGIKYKPYKNWLYRFQAREEYRFEHTKVTVLKVILSFFISIYNVIAIVAAVLIPIVLLDTRLHFVANGSDDYGFVLFLVVTCTIPRALYWYFRYRKPTPFELEYEKHREDR